MIKLTYLEVKNVTVQYDTSKQAILSDIHFSLNKGEWLSVLGINGSGKSTLVHWIMGFLAGQQGELLINGQIISDQLQTVRDKIAFVMQNPEDQFIGVTVRDDVAFGLENMGLPTKEMQMRVEEGLDLVGMRRYGDSSPQQLSGGQMQRVALAGAYVTQKEILLLDEVTSMLDPKGRKMWLDLLANFRYTREHTIISVTHDMEETRYADKILVLKEGKQIYFGLPKDFFSNVDLVKRAGLACPFRYQAERYIRKYGDKEANEIFQKMGWTDAI